MTQTERTTMERQVLAAKGDILTLCHRAGKVGAHLGGCLSMAELLTVLYTRHLRFDPQNPLWEERDRFVLSKGHGGIAQYAAMHQAGILTEREMAGEILGEGTILYKHPQRNPGRGIEFTGGSLGQGLAFALGEAMALKRKGNGVSRVYCLVGDGELNEGSIWEALSVIGHQRPENLTLLVDVNGLQLDGYTKDIQQTENLRERLTAFGFQVKGINGHDIAEIDAALTLDEKPRGPIAILAHTKKGHGVSFAEDNVDWHSKAMTEEQYQLARRELGVDE